MFDVFSKDQKNDSLKYNTVYVGIGKKKKKIEVEALHLVKFYAIPLHSFRA